MAAVDIIMIGSFDKCKLELQDEDIKTRREFRLWALSNHPDRGGNLEIFQRISQCAGVNIFETVDQSL